MKKTIQFTCPACKRRVTETHDGPDHLISTKVCSDPLCQEALRELSTMREGTSLATIRDYLKQEQSGILIW